MPQSKTDVSEKRTGKTNKERVDSIQVERIKSAMKAGEFSIGTLAKEHKWPFQKVRHHVHAIANKENKKLTSVSRGIWVMQ